MILTAGCAGATAPHATPPADAYALAVLPRVGLGPRDVSVTARMDKDPSHRNVCLAFVQDEIDVIQSCHTMNGDHEPRFWQHIFEQVPAGAYTVQLRVTRADGGHTVIGVDVCYAGQLKESCGLGESAP
jgi:hypothetical protein